MRGVFAIPLACRIHEGVVFSNRDKLTLLDKMIMLVDSLDINENYRKAVRRKIDAYHRHIQIGLIAHGLVQYLASVLPETVWMRFGSWIRTIRPGICPSELVTAIAMRNTLPVFLAVSSETLILVNFLRERIDVTRTEGARMIA